jgi:SAM-dependent methyltransferase
LLEEGFRRVSGCEPSHEAKEKADPRVKNSIHSGFFKPGIYEKNSFDLICSFQTLDHLSDPAEILKTCRDILRPQGMIYFVTHDVDSLQARILREKSPIIDVEHIYLFNKKTLKRLFEEPGFKVLRVADLKNSYPINYWLRMLLKGRVGLKFNDLIRRSGLGSISLPLAAGNIFVIAKKG